MTVENGGEEAAVLENGNASVLSNDGSGSSSTCAFVPHVSLLSVTMM